MTVRLALVLANEGVLILCAVFRALTDPADLPQHYRHQAAAAGSPANGDGNSVAMPQISVGRAVRCWRLHVAAAALVLAAASATLPAQSLAGLRALVGRTMSGSVISIVDGDTVHVALRNSSTLTVRLDGIDTPERGEPFSAQATRATRVLLFPKTVELTGTDVDRYGRLVARIRVGGVDVSEALVHQGLACHFTRYSSDPVLARAQQDAQRRAIGFWAPGVQRPACVTAAVAAARPRPTSGPFHGNTASRVFHAPTCRNYKCRNCTAMFPTMEAAEAAGFTPAGDCLR
jgi:endonuclease YncB( thermonuclease family)